MINLGQYWKPMMPSEVTGQHLQHLPLLPSLPFSFLIIILYFPITLFFFLILILIFSFPVISHYSFPRKFPQMKTVIHSACIQQPGVTGIYGYQYMIPDLRQFMLMRLLFQ